MSPTYTVAPVTKPLRDWLRGQIAAVGQRVYAGGLEKDATLPAIALERVGGFTTEPLDRPLIQFDVWASKGDTAETVAMALVSLLLSTAPGTQVAAGLAFMGATVESAVWLPDPASQTPRFVITVEVTTRAA